MNILFVTATYPLHKGGICDASEKMFEAFMHQNVSQWLMTGYYEETKDHLKGKEYSDRVVYVNPEWQCNYKNYSLLKKNLNEKEIDVIHIEYPGDYRKGLFVNFLPIYIKWRNCFHKKKIKVFVRLHEFSKARRIRRIAIIPIFLFSTNICIPALFDYELLKKYFGKKITKGRIGSNIEITKVKTSVHPEKTNISYFGDIYKNKGIENLLSVFEKIKNDEKKEQFNFTIIGSMSTDKDALFCDYHKYILDVIKKKKLENDIRITGYLVEEVERELCNTDIALLLYDDGISLRRGSFLAYLTHGVPIITTAGDKECQQLFGELEGVYMAKSLEDIIRTIYAWSEDKEKLLDRGKKNLELTKYFTWENIGKQTIDGYEKVRMK